MEQPIINERAEDRSVAERVEGVEDQLQLLKSEVRQTLIDLREFMMKGSALSITSAFDGSKASTSNGHVSAAKHQESPSSQEPPVETKRSVIGVPEAQDAPPPQESAVDQPVAGEAEQTGPVPHPAPVTPPMTFPPPIPAAVLPSVTPNVHGGYSMDAIKMGHIIKWLGTVARKGLTPNHLKPYLQAYEQSGLLTQEMAVLTYRSLEHLEYAIGRTHQTYSTAEYSDCLLELHEIVCNPGYAPKEDSQVGGNHSG